MTGMEYMHLLEKFSDQTLLDLFYLEAIKNYDGHYTIFSFTTEFKAAFGTVDLDGDIGRKQVQSLKGHNTLKEALIDALVKEIHF